MGTILVWCVGGALVWLFISQFISWMLVVDKTEEAVQSMWACVFLSPIMFAMIALAFIHQRLAVHAKRTGLPVEPDNNPMEYLP